METQILQLLRNRQETTWAAVMLTLPSTIGLFDTNILEVCRIVHDAGGIVYGDGANMNALLGRVKLGDLGFDIVHLNLHKTFSTPHGGGGPGAGPICAVSELLPFMPTPVVELKPTNNNNGEENHTLASPPQTIGRMGAFHGNFGVLIRAYAYISILGAIGLSRVSEDAVINANYILNELKGFYHLPYDRHCMHEVVFSATNLRQTHGVTAMEVAKRLIDYGIHPPTMYFPLIVDEALMIEPTETETKDTIDNFVEVMKAIAHEASERSDLLHSAPHNTPNNKLDEASAARYPRLRWQSGADTPNN